MATKILLPVLLSLLVSAVVGSKQQTQLTEAQQCRLDRLKASRPSRRIQSEGGVTELYDENEDQFQCAGVAAMRNTLKPNALSLPNFHPAPRLVYVEKGRGLLGIINPGCAETYHSQQGSSGREEEQEEKGSRRDKHQKVHRITQGDIVLLNSGVTHFCLNDGNEDLIAVSIDDLNNDANQLDRKFRAFYLAGGVPKEQQQGEPSEEPFQNIIRNLDEEMMAEAFNIPVDVMRQIQGDDDRGLIVQMQEDEIRVIRPDEKREEEEEEDGNRGKGNALQEAQCSAKINQNIDRRREAYVYSRQAGRLTVADEQTLPLLQQADLSAESLTLQPDALYAPQYSMNSHTIVYVTQGEARVQIANSNGQTAMDETVSRGDMFVVPQLFVWILRAEREVFKFVAFKTNSRPATSPLVGYTSVMRGLPLQVIANSYQISPEDARRMKENRRDETLLLSPRRSSS